MTASIACPLALCGCTLLFSESTVQDRGVDADIDAPQGPEACTDTLVTFDGLPGDNAPVFQHGGLDFQGTWGSYRTGEIGAPSNAIAFFDYRDTGSFAFEAGERILRGLRVYRSTVDVTLTIADGTNPDVEIRLDSSTTSARITTNWLQPSKEIQVTSTEGWQFFVDDICYDPP